MCLGMSVLPWVDPEELTPSLKTSQAHYLSLKMGPRLPRQLSCGQISTLGIRFLPCALFDVILSSVFACLLLRVGPEGFFLLCSMLGHLKRPQEQVWSWDAQGQALFFQRGSPPVPAAQPVGWGTLGATPAQESPPFSVSHPPWHGPSMALSRVVTLPLIQWAQPRPVSALDMPWWELPSTVSSLLVL